MKHLFSISAIVLSCIVAAKPTVHTINSLTMYPGAAEICTTQSIHQIIYHINKKNAVPDKSYVKIDDQLYTIARGIEVSSNDSVVAIFSRGYAKTNDYGTNGNFLMRGACALSAHIQFKDTIVHGIPLISFDYDDSKKGFAFGQESELEILELVYETVLSKNPSAQIILIGDCRGAKVVLELLTKKPRNIAAAILMAPFTSARDLTNKIAENYLSYIPLSKTILHNFFKLYFPSYKAKKDDLVKRLNQIDPTLPILIANREHDTLVTAATVKNLIKALEQQGNTSIRTVTVKDKDFDHSMMTGNLEVRQAINRFLRDYSLPHHPAYALDELPKELRRTGPDLAQEIPDQEEKFEDWIEMA